VNALLKAALPGRLHAPLAKAFVLLLLWPGLLRAEDRRASTVGLPARLEGLVLPGPELEVKPLADRRAPVVVRIVQVWPHGTAFRYDLEYYGLEPGKFDLKDYLRRKDSSAPGGLPAIPIEVRSVLPPGQVRPNELPAPAVPRLGGYLIVLLGVGVLWLLGLVAILVAGRRKTRAAEHVAGKPRTLADHLQPLVEGALAGRLAPAQLAELERSLLVYWERRLELRDRKPVHAMAELRRHPEAGPLLQQLEVWLHRPGAAGDVDVAALLKPYRHLPAAALDLGVKAS